MTDKTPTELRDEAARQDRAAQESFERSDTDGFLSQWALGLGAQEKRLQAEIIESGGVLPKPGLFNAAGQRVKAKLVMGRDFYGNPEQKWVLLDEHDFIIEWVNIPSDWHAPSRRSKMSKLGLHVEHELAPVKAGTVGSGHGLSGALSVRVVAVRQDKGYPEGAIVYQKGA